MAEQKTPKKQPGKFIVLFPTTLITVFSSMYLIVVYLISVSKELSIYSLITTSIGDISYLPFFVTSGMAVSLYLVLSGFSDRELDGFEPSNQELNNPSSRDGIDTSFFYHTRNILDFTAPSLLVASLVTIGAISSAYLSTHGLPYSGVIVAIVLPLLEIEALTRTNQYVTPSAWLFLISLLPLTPLIAILACLGVIYDGVWLAYPKMSRLLKYIVRGVNKTLNYIPFPSLSAAFPIAQSGILPFIRRNTR